jgi:hypothetical protein
MAMEEAEREYFAQVFEDLRAYEVTFEPGLTEAELAAVEERFAFRFPPDLQTLLQIALPTSRGFPNWRRDPEDDIRHWLAWPLHGIGFDVEHNGFWMTEWGDRPRNLSEAKEIARRAVAAAPALIPVYQHRFLPAEPHEAGNPVLSV